MRLKRSQNATPMIVRRWNADFRTLGITSQKSNMPVRLTSRLPWDVWTFTVLEQPKSIVRRRDELQNRDLIEKAIK